MRKRNKELIPLMRDCVKSVMYLKMWNSGKVLHGRKEIGARRLMPALFIILSMEKYLIPIIKVWISDGYVVENLNDL